MTCRIFLSDYRHSNCQSLAVYISFILPSLLLSFLPCFLPSLLPSSLPSSLQSILPYSIYLPSHISISISIFDTQTMAVFESPETVDMMICLKEILAVTLLPPDNVVKVRTLRFLHKHILEKNTHKFHPFTE